MKLTRNTKLLVGTSVSLTTWAFYFAAAITFDRYPLPIKVVLLVGILVGATFQIWGVIEEKNLASAPKDRPADL